MKYIISFWLLCVTALLTVSAAAPDTLYHELYRSQYQQYTECIQCRKTWCITKR